MEKIKNAQEIGAYMSFLTLAAALGVWHYPISPSFQIAVMITFILSAFVAIFEGVLMSYCKKKEIFLSFLVSSLTALVNGYIFFYILQLDMLKVEVHIYISATMISCSILTIFRNLRTSADL